MSPAKTAAERKADERERHKEARRTAVTVHVRPEYVPEVRALEAKLQRVKNRSANDPDVVVGAMVDDVRCKALQDAARWVDEEIGHAIQDGWSVEAVQALMATRDMLKAHADMHATTVELKA